MVPDELIRFVSGREEQEGWERWREGKEEGEGELKERWAGERRRRER